MNGVREEIMATKEVEEKGRRVEEEKGQLPVCDVPDGHVTTIKLGQVRSFEELGICLGTEKQQKSFVPESNPLVINILSRK